MNLNNITFPYPVLGSFDDILPAPSEPEVEIYQDKKNYHFVIKLGYENKEIEKLVEQDYADYVCEVSCDMTRYRRCFKGKLLHFQIDIPRKSVAGRINFSCTITLKKELTNYTNENFHPDYNGHTFDMDAGDLLGILGQFYYYADIKYDKLKAVGTFMEINETEDPLPATILDKDKIELRLPTALYLQYKDNPAVNSNADILHASIVLNSLIYALCRIERYYDRKWAETIIYRIDTEPEFAEFMDQDPEDWRVDKLAQLLLENHTNDCLISLLIRKRTKIDMALQKILTQSYIERVFEEVERGEGLDRFLQESFPYEEEKLLVTPQVKEPVGLLERMVPTTEGDFLSAVALYDAYKSLKPLQAINAQFWESLTLTDLFPYMQKRWNLPEANDLRKRILNHFTFKAHGMMRHGLAGLWWLVYLSIDEQRDNKYELTEYLFKNYTLRFIRFGAGKVIQHKEAALGILQYIKDNEANIPSLENVANGLTSYFNKLGAVKQLTFLDRDFFYNEMAKHIEEFKVATTHYERNENDYED